MTTAQHFQTGGRRRPWTRLGTVAATAHVFYELAAGVGMPLSSRVGAPAAATLWSTGGVLAYRQAGRQPAERDAAFAVLDGVYLAAVLAHFSGWPRRRGILPWLTECEGLRGRVIGPYNMLLHVSAVAAAAGLAGASRGRTAGVLVPVVLTPLLVHEQHREVDRLRRLARRHPRWWNRRLQPH